MAFLSHVYYGNTLTEWIIALFMIFGSVLLARALHWLLSFWLKGLLQKTKTMLDDLLLEAIQGPFIALVALVGAHMSVLRLHLAEGVRSTVSTVLSVLLSLGVAWAVARVYQAIHEGYLVPAAAKSETTFDDQILPVLRSGIILIIWVLGFIIGLNNAGFNVSAVLASMGLGGLAVALAAQDTIANIFGGFTIFVQKPFKVGDLIIFEGKTGRVKEVGLRATRLEDFDTSHAIHVPNSQFIKSSVINVSADPGHWATRIYRLAPDVTAAKVEQAIALIREAIGGHPDIEKVLCRLNTFDNSTIELFTQYHVRHFGDRWRVITEVHLAVMRQFEQNGLRFALPIRVLYDSRAASDEGERPPSI